MLDNRTRFYLQLLLFKDSKGDFPLTIVYSWAGGWQCSDVTLRKYYFQYTWEVRPKRRWNILPKIFHIDDFDGFLVDCHGETVFARMVRRAKFGLARTDQGRGSGS
jgi:hypothetical protein